ncbi:hypothetical protein [Streptomyces sp. NPDC048603]|uniref:hypothetical protein n=1 Tax=Streptomyces sp. NPDC048603 TaxID=3365577 RepID=UPI003720C5D9
MLAEEFGYQVSPQPAALQTPGVLRALERDAQAMKRRVLHLAAWVTGALVFFIAVILQAPLLALFPLGSVAIGLGLAVPVVKRQRRAVEEQLRTRPWQVWPARVRESGDKQWPHLMELLAPDRTAAATFRCRLPQDVWIGMTDGRGVVWICGDLRFGGVAALPGAERAWPVGAVSPAQQVPPAPAGQAGALEEELVREAARVVAWNLFG